MNILKSEIYYDQLANKEDVLLTKIIEFQKNWNSSQSLKGHATNLSMNTWGFT